VRAKELDALRVADRHVLRAGELVGSDLLQRRSVTLEQERDVGEQAYSDEGR